MYFILAHLRSWSEAYYSTAALSGASVKSQTSKNWKIFKRCFTTKIAGMSELNYWERLKQFSLFSIQQRREQYIILHVMWKILNSKTSNDLSIEFVFRPRLGNLANIPVCKKSSSAFHWTTYERSFAIMGPKLWNCIP